MSKRVIMAIILLVIAFTGIGCPFWGTADHTRAHERTIDQGWNDIHHFSDRYFWNYDWNDPHDH